MLAQQRTCSSCPACPHVVTSPSFSARSFLDFLVSDRLLAAASCFGLAPNERCSFEKTIGKASGPRRFC